MARRSVNGFTLAELLIALAILGEIATFTIPKILTAQGIGTNKAILKETASIISQAYQMYRLKNTVNANTEFAHLTPYINYVSVQTAGSIDDHGASTVDCASTECLRMHNGSVIFYNSGETFDGTTANNTFHVCVDPDGVKNASTINDPGTAICFLQYYDGGLRTRNTARSGSTNVWGGSFGPMSGVDPSWFSW